MFFINQCCGIGRKVRSYPGDKKIKCIREMSFFFHVEFVSAFVELCRLLHQVQQDCSIPFYFCIDSSFVLILL